MTLLILNAGSSSGKIALFEHTKRGLVKTHSGKIDWEQKPSVFILEKITSSSRKRPLKKSPLNQKTRGANLKLLFSHLKTLFPNIDRIGHRLVHGGDLFSKPTRITSKVKAQIKSLKSLAPLHNPIELKCIELAQYSWKKAHQMAVFDTAFFKTLPQENRFYPLPYTRYQKGIKRYGFHGLSHEYAVHQMHHHLKKKNLKVITCHLGNGCSIAASIGKKAIDTTMGFTPLDGVMMGTRPGTLDPGILLYLLKNKIYSLKELEHILHHESGLKGVSSLSEDLREILKTRSKNPQSKLAFELFVDSIAKGIAQMMTSLKGCNALVFTGGIGEKSPQLRRAVLKKLSFLGFQSGPHKKCGVCQKISLPKSQSTIWIVPSQEEEMIASHLNAH